jgi:hypothetical protein
MDGRVVRNAAGEIISTGGPFTLNGQTFDANNNTGSRYITDTRTRLFYTAKFNDDFKFVNKFEFNTTWGDNNGGDIGADGTGNWRIKNSYADFTLGLVNTKVGIQDAKISRGFLFDDDFSGIIATADFGMVKVPVVWIAAVDEEAQASDGDLNIFSVLPIINVNDNVKINPHLSYANIDGQETDVWWLGVDADLKFDAVAAWATAIYNGGEVDIDDGIIGTDNTNDVSAFLLAAGADAGIVHGEAFYSSGDDDGTDNDLDAFVLIGGNGTGSSYYWSEIMGLGIFDARASNGSPADNITNVWAANVGVTLNPMDKLKFDFDVWYAELAEDNAAGDSDLGLEFDGVLSYALMDNLNADFVLAYLVAGEATGDSDVIEGGLRLSLKF